MSLFRLRHAIRPRHTYIHHTNPVHNYTPILVQLQISQYQTYRVTVLPLSGNAFFTYVCRSFQIKQVVIKRTYTSYSAFGSVLDCSLYSLIYLDANSDTGIKFNTETFNAYQEMQYELSARNDRDLLNFTKATKVVIDKRDRQLDCSEMTIFKYLWYESYHLVD